MSSYKHRFVNKFETAGSQIRIKNPSDRKKADRGSGEGGGGEGYRKPQAAAGILDNIKEEHFPMKIN